MQSSGRVLIFSARHTVSRLSRQTGTRNIRTLYSRPPPSILVSSADSQRRGYRRSALILKEDDDKRSKGSKDVEKQPSDASEKQKPGAEIESSATDPDTKAVENPESAKEKSSEAETTTPKERRKREPKNEKIPEEATRPAVMSRTQHLSLVANNGSKSRLIITNHDHPETYPQCMALAMSGRPILPGFYKSIFVKNDAAIAAIHEMLRRGPAYIGAFLLKDETTDTDIITDIDQIYKVGVFAQVTQCFESIHNGNRAFQLVLNPIRRIHADSLVMSSLKGESVTESAESLGYESDNAFLKDYDISLVNNSNVETDPYSKDSPEIIALVNAITESFRDLAKQNVNFRDQMSSYVFSPISGTLSTGTNDPARMADFAAAMSAGNMKALQDILETTDVEKRLRLALALLKEEILNYELQHKVRSEVEQRVNKLQKNMLLNEQLKAIRKEMGQEGDTKEKLVETFKERVSKLKMPESAQKVFDDELSKFQYLEPQGSEFNVTRTYLDWLTRMPWGKRTPENFNIPRATSILDEDHYGLADVKDRIKEFIAVGKLRGTVQGKILCFVGPPGVGKTSIGKSIAKTLNRKFFRFSVGGMWDSAEIKGHRRTYIGAMPGKLVQAFKMTESENPLILIDEIEKVGSARGSQGDPKAALLEVLDPEQNSSFMDHYLDTPLDLSNVLFVCTANSLDGLPQPLLDRMEVIEISGYTFEEKAAIAAKYLEPVAREAAGLKDADVKLVPDAVDVLIKQYCRESGVRNLKKQIEKVYRKVALKIVSEHGETTFPEAEAMSAEAKEAVKENVQEPLGADATDAAVNENAPAAVIEPRQPFKVPESVHVEIGPHDLQKYVGVPIWTNERLYEFTPPGVVMGLSVNPIIGGTPMYIETALATALSRSTRPSIQQTGSLQSVLQESISIAYSFAKVFMTKHFPRNGFFDRAQIHVHLPEGAIPKDGPSAGLALASALLSLALDHPLGATVAMTGEISLIGKVLRIGGLREKTIAAKRSGATTILFPKGNMAEWEDIPKFIKDGIEGKPMETYDEAYRFLFKDLDVTRAWTMWKDELEQARQLELSDNSDRRGNEKNGMMMPGVLPPAPGTGPTDQAM